MATIDETAPDFALQGADGKYRLREELRYRYNKIFKGRIGRLYFTTFVVQ